jgi:tRNA-2-methylthio-N6-dimethylallyladenosine synthase
LDCVARLRRAIPKLALTTDVIVGFPGETEEDFRETLDVVREIGFEDAYTFKFSPRDGTAATRFPPEDTVSDTVASDRLAELIDVVRGASRRRNMGLLGTEHEVLAERMARRGDGEIQARTRDFKTVVLRAGAAVLGGYYRVRLTGTTGSTFTGEIIGPSRALPVSVT